MWDMQSQFALLNRQRALIAGSSSTTTTTSTSTAAALVDSHNKAGNVKQLKQKENDEEADSLTRALRSQGSAVPELLLNLQSVNIQSETKNSYNIARKVVTTDFNEEEALKKVIFIFCFFTLLYLAN